MSDNTYEVFVKDSDGANTSKGYFSGDPDYIINFFNNLDPERSISLIKIKIIKINNETKIYQDSLIIKREKLIKELEMHTIALDNLNDKIIN